MAKGRNSPLVVHHFKAEDHTGKKAQYFVVMDQAKEAEFLKAAKQSGNIDLRQYGRVVASFYGDKPPPEVKKMLDEKYGFKI